MNRTITRMAATATLAFLALGGTPPLLAQATGNPPAGAATQPGKLPQPKGSVILTVSGNIGVRNTADAAVFDAAMVRALPAHSIHTRTPWYKQAVTFKGPRLKDLLDAVGAQGKTLRIVALNDYAVEVPIEDAERFDPILSYEVDGKRLSVRDKGPLFLVYPFDSRLELKNDLYYGRSIWQISSITVK
ncbi:molybdopterin-dependent oxidoreductase [Ramlibacter sp. 2FC]|uniref:molybdopterin-dependent oxidoreductase n=1 Tax=Ramlibacter sp. 2FC TaxID=2502188 RepID=UPI00201DEC9C|nr:molybdopterin-dependent oxidoreductase [Ramlibacter sp. 2FC]